MDWLKQLFGPKDPYTEGLSARWEIFTAEKVFTTRTAPGCKVAYKVVCQYKKKDLQEFKAARMLEPIGEDRFMAAINREVILPAIQPKGRFFRLLAERFPFPVLCHFSEENGQMRLVEDNMCIELNRELSTLKPKICGCSPLFLRIEPCGLTADMIEENYKYMRNVHDISSIRNMPEYAAVEEAMLATAAKQYLDLQNSFRQAQTEQVHKGERFAIGTRMAGRSLEILWKFNQELPSGASMRGYTKSGGFSEDMLPLGGNGTCVVDSKISSSTVLSLSEGTAHFFTFAITRAGETKLEVIETLRFSVRVPTIEELSHADKLILTLRGENDQKPKLSKRTTEALRGVLSEFELDEALSELEKGLIERISRKDYSTDEKADKIDRLKAVVESLRMGA